ncbi:MAG TPA: response regulator [Anaeromyxobacteraceae bacterium]|nr:response regulator [Anaeromyxobacteraceae bacterium]
MASLLLIDGDRNFREALAVALRLDGCRVDSAESVSAGLTALDAADYDLCVVDLHVADADRLLGAAVRGPVPVLITGPHADLLELAAHRHPAAGVIPKPFGAAELLDRVRSAAHG